MRRKLFELAEHLEAAMDDDRLSQELSRLAEYGSNEDLEVLSNYLDQFRKVGNK